jgi:phosphoribosylanthranilate isomerase
MHPRIKICGITNVKDAVAAVEAGADALGFIFYDQSPRWIQPGDAAKIIRELPPLVAKVGVFVNPPEETVRQTIRESGIDTLQFHGDESPEFCRRFALKVIKAFRVRDEQSLHQMPEYKQEAWLLDTYVAGKLGGSGEQFNWELACQAVKLSQQVILAGGLTPQNVALAVRQVRPFAVDVSSGVEVAPGQKDHRKIQEFITIVRSVEAGAIR